MTPRRVLVALILLGIGVAGGLAVGRDSQPNASTETVRVTTFEVVNGRRSAGPVPSPLPTFLEGPSDPHDLPLASAVPADADLVSADYVKQRPKQLIVTWSRGGGALRFRRGMTIWQLGRHGPEQGARWRRVYTFERPAANDKGYVESFDVTTGDISGDGRPEVLVLFSTGGSAGNGTYRLFLSKGYRLAQPLVRRLSIDEGAISFSKGGLLVDEGRDFHGVIHCCFRKVRKTLLRWDGGRLVAVSRTIRPNVRGQPPG